MSEKQNVPTTSVKDGQDEVPIDLTININKIHDAELRNYTDNLRDAFK